MRNGIIVSQREGRAYYVALASGRCCAGLLLSWVEMENGHPAIRVLALMEAQWVTGPAKNLIHFAGHASEPDAGLPAVRVSIATFRRGAREMPFVDAARSAGIPVYVIPERLRYDLGVLSALREIIRKVQPDIIQTHHVKSHALVRLCGAWRYRPWIAFNHGYTSTDLKDRLYNLLDRWSLLKADRVVVVCRPFAARLQRIGIPEQRMFVRHNSVAPFIAPPADEILAARNSIGVLPGTPVVLSVGRLSREKGHADLLDAMGLLRRSVGSCRLVVVGDGPEREALAAQSTARGLGGLVVFAGHRTDVRPFYAMADVLALPSNSEGSPNVVLEAMAAGVPVVATAVGGVPEIISDGNTGLIVPPNRPAAMADALARLLLDPLLCRRLGAAGQSHVTEYFSPQAYRRSLVTLYQDALGRNAKATRVGEGSLL